MQQKTGSTSVINLVNLRLINNLNSTLFRGNIPTTKGKEVHMMDLDSLVSKINKLSKVVRALTQLALEIGTLVAVVRFIIL